MVLKKEVMLVVLVLLSMSAYSVSYSVDLIVYKDRAEVDNLRVTGATSFDHGGVGSHTLSLFDGENNMIHEFHFTPNFVTTDHPPQEVDKTYESFRFPYDPRAKVLVLTNDQGILLTQNNIDDMVCNDDGTCGGSENAISCLNDCPSGVNDKFCDGMLDGVCDPDCCDPVCSQSRDPDCRIDSVIALDCGNGICDDIETHLTCPADCKGRSDGMCDGIGDGVCDPDCTEDEDLDCLTVIDPIEPVDPIEPIDPTEPIDPIEPIDIEPVVPIEPVDPVGKEDVNGNFMVIVLIAGLIIAAVLIFFFKGAIHKKLNNEDYRRPDSALEDYVKRNLKSGFSKDQIVNTLTKHGHSEGKINDIMRKF